MSTSNPEQPIQRVSKVYVAGSSAELERAERAIAELEAAGIVVTSTWPLNVRDQGGIANPTEAPRDLRQRYSTSCLGQLRDADLLWVLVPDRAAPTIGAWVEYGYAIAFNKQIVFSGDTRQSIFCSLGLEFASDERAHAYIVSAVDEELRSAQLRVARFDELRRETEQWRITSRALAQRLRNLRGIDDPDLQRVIDQGLPIAEVTRG